MEEVHPDTGGRGDDRHRLANNGETADLTIYRTVRRRGPTHFRHSQRHAYQGEHRADQPGGRYRRRRRACARQDNGGGLPADHKLGLGLTGMRERVKALGGSVTVASADNGVVVEAMIPVERVCSDATVAGNPQLSRVS